MLMRKPFFRLFLPVQYGTKPEGRLVPMTTSTAQAPRTTAVTTASTTTTAAQSTQSRGKPTLTSTTSTQGKISRILKNKLTKPHPSLQCM